jgi:hypothetical protein
MVHFHTCVKRDDIAHEISLAHSGTLRNQGLFETQDTSRLADV